MFKNLSGAEFYEALKLQVKGAFEYLLQQTLIQGRIRQRCFENRLSFFTEEDVVLDTGGRVHKAIQTGRYRYETNQTHPVSFAIDVAKNVIHEYRRSEEKNIKIKDMIPPEQNNDDWRFKKVEYAISLLSNPKYRQILELRILDGYDYAEIIQERLMEGKYEHLRNLNCKATAALILKIKELYDLDYSEDFGVN